MRWEDDARDLHGHAGRLDATARELFEVIRDGKMRVEIRHVHPLAEAAQAHRDLEGRRTVGSNAMVP